MNAISTRPIPTNRAIRPLPAAALALLCALSLSGCDSLLDVESDPNVVDASRPINIQEAVVGATVDLMFSFDEKISFGGLFGDEFVNSGTAPAIQLFDQRNVPTDHGAGAGRGAGLGGGFYIPLQRTNTVAELHMESALAGGFPGVDANSPEFARLAMFAGFAKTFLADLYCTVAFRGTGPEHTAAEAYGLAQENFTTAISATGVEAEVLQASLVGRARVRLILGDDPGAMADAELVDPNFEFLLNYSTNTFEQRNRVAVHVRDVANWSVGPDFRGLTIDDTGIEDPRTALDGPFPGNEPSQPVYAPVKVPGPAAPLRLATGDEARYIVAELVGGSAAVDIINEVRQRYGITQTWTPTGSDPNEILDKLIDERKRTLFVDGVRLGDLRRYIDKYGLDFFPTSTPQGFPMGDQTCMPLPDIERENNPGLSG